MIDISKNLIGKNEYGLYSIPKEISYTYTAQLILDGGVHEDTTIKYLQSIGGNIIHAGSGFGDFLPALKNCNKIWTFEPNTLMYESSLETISLNKLVNVEIFPYALSDSNGIGNLKHIDEKGLEMGPRSEMGNGVEVKTIKLDSIISNDTKISLIHLDLEGYEFEALKGAKEIIERDKPIIVLEIDSRAVTYNDFMLSLGYVTHKQLIFNSNERMVFINTVYIHRDKEVKKDYWSSDLPLPLSPSDSDVDIYKDNMIEGDTLMLGCTKKLIPISNIQMDIDPWYENETVIKGDWLDNKTYYDNIIADGSLSFTKDLTDGLIEMASKNCKVFITRTFTKRLPIMRIADYFPQPEDFKIPPTKTVVFEDYSFYIWQF